MYCEHIIAQNCIKLQILGVKKKIKQFKKSKCFNKE